jgi:eukaryotic-like serine/threonine-protein kinase
MSPERWRRIEEAYHRVLSSAPEQRAAILDESCSSDLEIRREVESLLAARDKAEDFLSPDDLPRHLAELEPESRSVAIGTKLGEYEIRGVLGAGGMGEVYRARDVRLGREVALKILPPYLTHDSGRVARFQSEARAASALNHPNAVTIYEIGQASGIWFIAAELVEGVTLRERIRRGPLSIDEAVGIALQSALALEAAHSAGIIHRDIKPENIMLRRDGTVKIVDFGLARILEPERNGGMDASQTGSVMGTPRYMAPEQARGQKPDARSDVFSLGAVLFEMVRGVPAFPGSTAPEVFAALLGSEPSLDETGALAPILRKALAKEPAARYPSMDSFIGDLRTIDATKDTAQGRRPKPVLSSSGLRWIAALVAFSAAALVGYRWLPTKAPTATDLKVVPIANFAGPKGWGALSPDGNQIVFSWRAPGSKRRHLYLKPVGEGEPRQLTQSDHDDTYSAWSPDGKQIAFTREVNGSQGLVSQDVFLIAVEGGTERKVGQTWRGVSWSPDGKTLALTRVPNEAADPAQESGGVYLLSLATGETRELTKAQRDSFPVFSPDGKWMVLKRQIAGSAAQLSVMPAEGGEARQVTFDPLQPIRAATWTPDSREVVFASLRSGADGSLWRVSVDGGAPRPVSATLRDASDPSISPQGRMAYLEDWMDTNLYLFSAARLNRDVPAGFGEPLPVVNSSREDHSPAFSPDGERIAFVSERSGHLEIWVARRDGSQPFALTSLRAQTTGSPRWSPDGKRIAFDSWASGKSSIYVVDANGGAPKRLTHGPLGSWMPSWSPDGNWIYYSTGALNPSEIYRVPAGGGEPVRVTQGGGFEPKAGADGFVYYSKRSATGALSLWSVPAGGGDERPVPELQSYGNIGRSWGVTDGGIYFMSSDPSPQRTVSLLSFRTRQVTPLFRVEKQMQWGIGTLALSRDGRYALAAQLDHTVNDLIMIENFR